MPEIYDMNISDATGGSSAAPTYFDPKVNEN
jgi:patatin-like phospholipase/acyl hydrolase